MRRPTRLVVLAALFAFAACLPGARAPDVPALRTLELSGTPPPASAPGAFAIVFVSPSGETREASEVTVVFNRPMRALETAGTEAPPPARIVVAETGAAPRGAWRWMGTSAVVFAPDPALSHATEYVVSVPAGTRALSGESLERAFEQRFSTPRPSLARVDPGEGEEHLAPSATFEARFDQPVDVREVQRAAKLTVDEAGKARAVALRVSRVRPDDDKTVKLVPATPLPLDAAVTLAFDASLRGVQGPLPMGEASSVRMHTYGPLSVREIGCSKSHAPLCHPLGAFEATLSNRVAYADFKSHVHVTQDAHAFGGAWPSVPIRWPALAADESKSEWFGIGARIKPGSAYRVTITAGLRDEYGQTLARDVVVPLQTDDLDPSVLMGMSGTVIEAAPAARAHVVPITSVNVAAYSLLTGALDERGVADVIAGGAREWESSRELFECEGCSRCAITAGGDRRRSRHGRCWRSTTIGAWPRVRRRTSMRASGSPSGTC